MNNLGGATCLLNMDSEIETGDTASTVTVEAGDTESVTVTVDSGDVTVAVESTPEQDGVTGTTDTEGPVTLQVQAARDALDAVRERPTVSFLVFVMLLTFTVVAPTVVFAATEFLMTLSGVLLTFFAARRLR